MPILNVKVSAKRSPEMTRAIADILLDLTVRILHKKREVTSIAIDYIDPADWIVGGRSLAEQGRRPASTSTSRSPTRPTRRTRRREYIREAFEAFARLLGNLHEESYIHVHDVRAAAYGYGGKTQEFRYHRGS